MVGCMRIIFANRQRGWRIGQFLVQKSLFINFFSKTDGVRIEYRREIWRSPTPSFKHRVFDQLYHEHSVYNRNTLHTHASSCVQQKHVWVWTVCYRSCTYMVHPPACVFVCVPPTSLQYWTSTYIPDTGRVSVLGARTCVVAGNLSLWTVCNILDTRTPRKLANLKTILTCLFGDWTTLEPGLMNVLGY